MSDPSESGTEPAAAAEQPASPDPAPVEPPPADGPASMASDAVAAGEAGTEGGTEPTTVEEAADIDDLSVEGVLATVTAERDEYLDALQRLKAEFANHRRRVDEQQVAVREQAAARLVEKLVPVLDGCTAALDQGTEEVRPISDALFETLGREGLAVLEPAGEPFDPEQHEAVMHEAGEGEQIVLEVLRPGYAWNGRVLRAAMVKVRG